MSITNIQKLVDLISTAKAVYSEFGFVELKQNLMTEKGGFTEVEADAFIERYEIAAPFESTSTGFEAIVFYDKLENKHVLAIRGSEQVIQDFLWADIFVGIGPNGIANHQAVDLYRYWKKATTTKSTTVDGNPVIYSDEELLKLLALWNGNSVWQNIDKESLVFKNFADELRSDVGVATGDHRLYSTSVVDVTGHSLGGNLVYGFASMFPDNVGQAVTINGPGLDRTLIGNGQDFLSAIGFSVVNESKITSINADGDWVHTVSGDQPGLIINIAQETGHDYVTGFDGLNNNHSVINGLDSLNLMNLFSKFDTTLVNKPAGFLSDMIRRSSHEREDTFEIMLDGLRRILFGDDILPTVISTKADLALRKDLHTNMDEITQSLKDGGSLAHLAGRLRFFSVAGGGEVAKKDYGQFLAIYYLTPFAIWGYEEELKTLNPDLYALWKADQNLTAEQIAKGEQTFSDTWYQDRFAMYRANFSRNTEDTQADLITNKSQHDIYYIDKVIDINLLSVGNTRPMPQQIVFANSNTPGELTGGVGEDHLYGNEQADILNSHEGNDFLFGGAGNDILNGGKGNDVLVGGADNDTLNGGEGHDTLKGGAGNDTYIFDTAFGFDTIIDSDGDGKIIINGITLNQFYKTDADGIVFRDAVENPKFEAVLVRDKNAQGVETQSLLIYEIANRENHLLIKDWQSGQMNLVMNDAPAVVRDAALIGNFTGDTNANFFTTQLHLQQQANNHLHINANGGEGRDYVQGFLNGSDQIEGSNGNDFLNAGALVEGVSDANPLQHYLFYSQPNVEGTDIINGGAGDDYIIVSGKQSVVHGGTENDIIHADETLSIKFTDFTKDGTAVTQDQLWQDLQQLLVPSAKKDITTENNTTTIKISSSIFNHDKVANDYVSFTSATGLTAWYLLIESATTSGAYVIDLVYSNTKPVLHKSPTTGEWKQDLTNVIASDNISPLNFNYLTGNQFAFDITTYQDQIGHSLFGDQGNDTIFGSYRSDQILGGDGEDNLIGLDGHDVIDGGKENDIIFGGSGKDTLIGGEGDDTILGNGLADRQNNLPDDDKIYGGAGKDKLYGGDGKDYIDGGVGEDTLYGEEGDDTLYGGDDEDKDTLVGGSGNDTIILNKNDVSDGGLGDNIFIIRDYSVSETKISTNNNSNPVTPTSNSSSSLPDVTFTPTVITPTSVTSIINNEGNNTISIVGRQNLNDAYVHSQNGNLYITQGNGQQVAIVNGAAGNGVQIQFGNNTNEFNAETTPSVTITDDDFLNQQKSNRITNTQQLMLNQMQSKATITGATAGGYLVGGIANDTLTAHASGSQLVGGKGDDQFNGNTGNDAYLIRRGDGEDTITEKGGVNTLKLGEGITADKITLHRDALDLLVTIDGSQTVRVVGMFDANGVIVNDKSVQAIQFYDGTQWPQTELLSKVTILPIAQNPIFATQGDTTHQYLLTQGNRIITDADGIDKLLLDAGITPDNVTITRNESDLFLTLNNGSVITVKNHFTSRAANTPDAQITYVVEQLQNRWLAQAENLINTHYGLQFIGEVHLNFEYEALGGELASFNYDSATNKMTLNVDLYDFATKGNGAGPMYYDRVIAHEMVHAAMQMNMDISQLPGWFKEGTAEFIHGADERVRGDLATLSNQQNFNALFQTGLNSPASSAGYAVSYIAVKLLDSEIRNAGGAGIIDLFAQLKTGKTLDQALTALSTTYPSLQSSWTNLASFEAHFIQQGYALADSLINFANTDTGSIAGSDYGFAPLDATSVVNDAFIGTPKYFTLIVSDQYLNTPIINGTIESVEFANGVVWDQAMLTNIGVTRIGTESDDVLNGTTGNDRLEGKGGYDRLYGMDGDDVLAGGGFEDGLYGGKGNDTYIYRLYDNGRYITDQIFEEGGHNTIAFEDYTEIDQATGEVDYRESIAESDIRLSNFGHLYIYLNGQEVLKVNNMFNFETGALNQQNAISTIRFSNGVEWDYERIKQEMLKTTDGNDVIYGLDIDNVISGGLGNDDLSGKIFNDTLIGGKDNDRLVGNNGADTYVYHLGDGNDNIDDRSTDNAIDTIQFGAGITRDNIRIVNESSQVVIYLPNLQKISITGMYDATNKVFNSDRAIEQIVFVDGSVLTQAQILQKVLNPEKVKLLGDSQDNNLIGSGLSETIIGYAGKDTLSGGGGDDEYLFNKGDGLDTVYDDQGNNLILLSNGYTESNIKLIRSVNNLLIVSTDTNDKITIQSAFSYSGYSNYMVKGINFTNGVEWNTSKILQMISYNQTDGNDYIYGTNLNDTIHGLAGDDRIESGAGIDYIYGDEGNDTLFAGDEGVIIGGKGNDFMVFVGGKEGQYYFELGDGIDQIRSSYRGDDYRFHNDVNIVFGDGIVSSDLKFFVQDDVLTVAYSAVDSIRVRDFFGNYDYRPLDLTIKFSSGDVMVFDQDIKPLLTVTDDTNNKIYDFNNTASVVHGYAGDDTIYGGDGADTLYGDDGKDTLYGGAGSINDRMYYGYDQGDTIYGGNGDDVIEGDDGNDFLYGEDGDDKIFGGLGNDSITGGLGNDYLHSYGDYSFSEDSNSVNTFIFDGGHGRDRVRNYSNAVFLFGESISPSELSIRYNRTSWEIGTDAESSISYDGNPNNLIMKFSNGEVWQYNQFFEKALSKGTDKGETIFGFDTDDVIEGGKGNDTLGGGLGRDTFIYNAGDGHDTIFDNNYGMSPDRLLFGVGISSDQVSLVRRGTSLIIIVSAIETIKLINQFPDSTSLNSLKVIDTIEFHDGTRWDSVKIKELIQIESGTPNSINGDAQNNQLIGTNASDQIFGYAGDDVISSGLGIDTLYGGQGNDELNGGLDDDILDGGEGDDIYVFGLTHGADKIVDGYGKNKILFDSTISIQNIYVNFAYDNGYINSNGNNIRITTGDNHFITIVNARNFNVIERVEFSNGVIWTYGDLLSKIPGYVDTSVPNVPTAVFDTTTGSRILGVAEIGSRVIVKNSSGIQIGIATANSTTGNYTVTLATPLINHETVTVTVQDAAGNISSPVSIVAPDLTAPLAPTATFDSTGKIVSGVAEADFTVIVKISGVEIGRAFADETTGAYTITLATALTNQEQVSVVVEDWSGNISVATQINAPLIVAQDITPPTIPTAAFDASTGKIISGIAEVGSTVIVKNSTGVQLGSVTADETTGAYNITLTTALINKQTVSVTAQDAAGNISNAITIIAPDLTPPSRPTATIDTAGLIISGAAEKGSTLVVTNINGVQIGTAVANSSTGSYSVTLESALINKEAISVVAIDAAGNKSLVRNIFAPDYTAPTTPTAVFNSTGTRITGIAEKGSTLIAMNADGVQIATVKASTTTGAYTLTITPALINKQPVNITATDAAGNISPIVNIIAPDKTAPIIPTAIFNEAGTQISGIAEAGTTVIVKNSSGTQIGTATADVTNGSFIINLPTALINKQTVKVTAKDDAGNTSVALSLIAPDLTAPARPTATIDALGLMVTGTAEKGSTLVVTNIAGVEIGSAVANLSTGAYVVTLSSAQINKEKLSVVAVDAAGNRSIIRSITAPDLTAPEAPTASLNLTGTRITGVAEKGSTLLVTDIDGVQIGTAKASTTTGAYTITLATAIVVDQTVNVVAKDVAGNTSAITNITRPTTSARVPEVDNRVEVLIQAMASFAPPSGIETNVISGFDDRSNLVIAVGQ